MKYAALFAFAGALLGLLAVSYGGWCWLLLWPVLSCFAISAAYFSVGTRVFGKQADGTMARSSLMVLLPYLICLWSVWHVLRLVCREDSHNRLAENLTIGRRLLASEVPESIEVIVDLTCEFVEPKAIRTSREYLSFPLLDGVAPSPQSIVKIVRQLSGDNRQVYIHCAQGHGRTGIIAAALLLVRGTAADAIAAVELVQAARPEVRLSRMQMRCLESAFVLMSEDRSG